MNINDPRIVLYIHKEMSVEKSDAFEKEMAEDHKLRLAVEEMKDFSMLLDEGFSLKPEETLTDTSRELIIKLAEKPVRKKKRHGFMFFLTRSLVPIAACYIIVMHWHKPEEDYSKQQLPNSTKKVIKALPVPMTTKFEKFTVQSERHEDAIDMELCDDAVEFDALKPLTVSENRAQPIVSKLIMSSMYGARVSPEKRKSPRSRRAMPADYTANQLFGQDDVSHNTETYDEIPIFKYTRVTDEPLSTFSIDVDTASYSNVRRMLNQGNLPPKGAVRIEEMINYFNYDYKAPQDDKPFSVDLEMANCPWNQNHRLVRIGLKGKEISSEKREAANLVFLLDVSGSMNNANKLPLLKKSLKMLVNNLKSKDKVAIVVYAGASGLVLPSTSCENRQQILDALDRLSAGGSTNGGAGIDLAYKTAVGNYIENGINRVILCTDGDFNVGTTNRSELITKIEKSAKTGVYLSVFGFGMGNYKDGTLEKLADKGNGNYGYIDTEKEAKKALVEQINGTLVTIAKDVKIQVEFNPSQIKAYRLIGYENRKLDKQDFNDDKKDAGEIGAGHNVTALYEVILPKDKLEGSTVDPLKYQQTEAKAELSSEVLTAKIRYKKPDEDKSQLLEFPLEGKISVVKEGSDNLRFAAGVSAFGMLLRDSKFKGTATYEMVSELCGNQDKEIRKEFLELVNKAKRLTILN